MPIISDEMAAMKEQAGVKEGPSLVDISKQVGDGLNKLLQAMDVSKSSDEEKAQLQGIIQNYSDLMENKLGQESGQEEPEVDSPVPMDAGFKGVPISHKYKN